MTDRQEKTKNAGFTLIELIVTVLIMSVLAGGAVIGVTQISNTNVTTCAERIMAAFDQARYENLYLEGEIRLELRREAGSFVAVTLQDKGGAAPEERRRDVIGDNRVTIRAERSAESGGGFVELTELTPIVFAFQKSSGALKEYDGAIYKKISVENAARTANIALVEHTGRCFLDVGD